MYPVNLPMFADMSPILWQHHQSYGLPCQYCVAQNSCLCSCKVHQQLSEKYQEMIITPVLSGQMSYKNLGIVSGNPTFGPTPPMLTLFSYL